MSATLQPYAGQPTDGGGRTPSGPRVEKVAAPIYTTRCATLQTMLQAIVDAGLTGRPAVLFLAHVSRETGYGQQVWNYNFGNVKQFGSGPWYRHGTEPYVAYPDTASGMAGDLNVLSLERYRAAREQLMAGDPQWYGTLGRAGYYEAGPSHDFDAAQAEYDGVLAIVDRCNLTIPSPAISWTRGLGIATGLALGGILAWLWKGRGTL